MIPYSFDIKMDLLSDWREFLISQFKRFPFLKQQDYINLPLEKLSILYFKWLNRMIQPAIRKVHYSKEFSCPANLEKGLEEIAYKIQIGQELTSHLTRSIKDITYNDGLLNDWGIHHLHLGVEEERDGFVKRNGDVLYALFNDNDAYLIQIMDHKSFSKQELVRILHRNWSETISKYRSNGINSLGSTLTDEDIHANRKAGANSLIEIDGVIYFPMGGGLTTAGTNVLAMRESDISIKWLEINEEHIRKNINEYVRDVTQKLGYQPNELEFKLLSNTEDNFFVYEKNSLIAFDIGKPY